MILFNYISGEWKQGRGEGIPLIDPVNGEHLAHASSDGLDFAEALEFSRERGSRVLQRLTYHLAIQPEHLLSGTREHIALAQAIYDCQPERAAEIMRQPLEIMHTKAMTLIRTHIVPIRGERF